MSDFKIQVTPRVIKSNTSEGEEHTMHKSSLVEKSKVSKQNYHKNKITIKRVSVAAVFKYQHQHKISPAEKGDGTENSVKLLWLSLTLCYHKLYEVTLAIIQLII